MEISFLQGGRTSCPLLNNTVIVPKQCFSGRTCTPHQGPDPHRTGPGPGSHPLATAVLINTTWTPLHLGGRDRPKQTEHSSLLPSFGWHFLAQPLISSLIKEQSWSPLGKLNAFNKIFLLADKNRLHGDEWRRREETEVMGVSRDSGEGQIWHILNGARSHTGLHWIYSTTEKCIISLLQVVSCHLNLMWLYTNILWTTKRRKTTCLLWIHAKTNIQHDQWFMSVWFLWAGSFERTCHITHC